MNIDDLSLEDTEIVEDYASLATHELMDALAKCAYIKKKIRDPELVKKIDTTVLYIREILVDRYAIH